MTEQGHVLVLGAYGLIGAPIARALSQAGHSVVALGRDPQMAARVLPGYAWVYRDLRDLTAPDDWIPLLTGCKAVVNCAGALQQGPDTDLSLVHHVAPKALFQACVTLGVHVVQISAVGANLDARTEFMRSKARGDAALRAANPSYTLFKPGLILSQTAYGGSHLLRLLAAFPVVQPLAFAKTPVQVVGVTDVAGAVVRAVEKELPAHAEIDLVTRQSYSLAEVVGAIRQWLGFAPARWTVLVPRWCVRGLARGADLLGVLGWLSPLRSTAVAVLDEGITGTGRNAQDFGLEIKTLPEILGQNPIGVEHRLHARMALATPFIIAALSLFWLVSGAIGLISLSSASDVLIQAGWSGALAYGAVIFWSLVDIMLGGAVLLRPWAKRACLAMAGVAMCYLVMASVVTPWMWADPLGPLIKIIPAFVLPLVARPLLDSR